MIDRRGALGAIGGGMALAATSPALAAGAGPGAAALDTPAGRMRAFMLMRGALDDRLVIGSTNASYWGCANGTMTPLFDVVSATFARYRPLGDGSYRSVTLEQAYFVDRTTGEWLHRFANPYTGKTVEVPPGGYGATAIIFTSELEMKPEKPMPGTELRHKATQFIVEGDDLMMTEITTATTAPRAGEPPTLFHETVGLHARLSEVMRPGANKVRSETSYTSVKSWRTWLEMGDHPGETVTTGQGLYDATPASLPARWIAAARRHRPELLVDPGKLLDPLWHAG